jgi:N-acetylmuramoyl-L-alanine amidase
MLLRDRLNDVPNMRAMLTRDADFFVPLQRRVRRRAGSRPTCSSRSMPTPS